MDVAEAIRLKRAVRSFAAETLPDEDVHAILSAGRRAQSSKNTQPWQFIAIRDRSTLETLSGFGTYAGHLAGARLGVVIATADPAQRWSIPFDAGQAAAYMQLAAWERGIGSCLATIYEPEKARRLLGAPDDVHLNVALSFGRPEDPTVLTSAPRTGGRRPLSDVVHWERW
ncbi:MAG TPA: nitroreductase family protein [Anaerolineales bacterium]|nr:nitroreductase family protein [Anaerolineales bacterium]